VIREHHASYGNLGEGNALTKPRLVSYSILFSRKQELLPEPPMADELERLCGEEMGCVYCYCRMSGPRRWQRGSVPGGLNADMLSLLDFSCQPQQPTFPPLGIITTAWHNTLAAHKTNNKTYNTFVIYESQLVSLISACLVTAPTMLGWNSQRSPSAT
jgi:hypothetical protein